MWERGYWHITTVRGIPLRAHWTLPLGALLFSGLSFAPLAWLAFFALVLIHELGHAVLVRRYGHRVLSIDVTGFGGLCRWAGRATITERGWIAWGGVAAQGLLLAVALVGLLVFGRPTSWAGAQLASIFISTNLWLIGLNLLPLPPLDGAQAWPALRRWLDRRRQLSRRGGSGLLR